ncbi:hypothetical protein INP81_08360 [Comamonas thiooxydans]|uniref:hypothetical protein n=1 Tax=Comamonas thiooxydans TaxID=363952 RepID=UPI0018A5D030|nr:hypothetical protein [Comamonas thiooxydans]QOQ83829.1 hypothetical protein INP81_08360 [Comamonas thiooxydans]
MTVHTVVAHDFHLVRLRILEEAILGACNFSGHSCLQKAKSPLNGGQVMGG